MAVAQGLDLSFAHRAKPGLPDSGRHGCRTLDGRALRVADPAGARLISRGIAAVRRFQQLAVFRVAVPAIGLRSAHLLALHAPGGD